MGNPQRRTITGEDQTRIIACEMTLKEGFMGARVGRG